MKRVLKDIFIIICLLLLTTCAFGGGGVYYLLFCIIFKIEKINEIIFLICTLVPVPFCFWLAPKFSDKFF